MNFDFDSVSEHGTQYQGTKKKKMLTWRINLFFNQI